MKMKPCWLGVENEGKRGSYILAFLVHLGEEAAHYLPELTI